VSEHVVQWVTASPLWPSALERSEHAKRREAMQRPAILRFERDSFMDDVAKLLDRNPAQLVDRVATPVTYRLPSPGETEPPAPAADDLKLFQAVHGHFYLVAATLTCRRPGLPEHEVNASLKERVVFVLRRVDADGGEWAWVDDPEAKDGKSWKHLDKKHASSIDAGEELLPLFPLRYTVNERLHRLYVGLVPTASSDVFRAAGSLSPLAGPDDGKGAPAKDPRPDALTAKVTNALRLLVETETKAPAGAKDPVAIEKAMEAQQVEASSFLLLDFAEFLHDTMGWFASDTWAGPTRAAEQLLWQTLSESAVSGGATSWRDALRTAWQERLVLSGDAPGPPSLKLNLHEPGLKPDQLDAAVIAALPPLPAGGTSALAISVQGDTAPPPDVPKLDARSLSRYVLRCAYQRPECKPPHPDVVSNPTRPFRIASFFDLDAPARSITIAMPIDTSIKDLRKLRKNVNFLLSNQLRSQMNRVTSLKDAMAGQFADGESLDVGLLCSFSIPVITICALMVLMIFISLLNIVFWWMPFLRICFPIALKAK
jgi:hypothetical protein